AIYIILVSTYTTVTIRVPKNKLRPTFFLGFLISPAIKVTFSQATLLNTEPTIAELISPIATIKVAGPSNKDQPAAPLESVTGWVDRRLKPVAQLAFQISAFA